MMSWYYKANVGVEDLIWVLLVAIRDQRLHIESILNSIFFSSSIGYRYWRHDWPYYSHLFDFKRVCFMLKPAHTHIRPHTALQYFVWIFWKSGKINGKYFWLHFTLKTFWMMYQNNLNQLRSHTLTHTHMYLYIHIYTRRLNN